VQVLENRAGLSGPIRLWPKSLQAGRRNPIT
jgi:hypothetical protein